MRIRGLRMVLFAVAAPVAFAVCAALVGCANVNTPPLGGVEMGGIDLGAINLTQNPQLPAEVAPAEAYRRVAGGLLSCWLARGRALGEAYVFHGNARPADKGGDAEIIIHERAPDGRRGLKAFEIEFAASGEGSRVAITNSRLPEPVAGEIRSAVVVWLQNEERPPCDAVVPGATGVAAGAPAGVAPGAGVAPAAKKATQL